MTGMIRFHATSSTLLASNAVLCATALGASLALAAPPAIPDSMLRAVPASTAPGHTFLLPATPETTVVGIFDSAQPPVLTIDPGDTVVMETLMVFGDRLVPGETGDDLPRLRAEAIPPGATAHTLTGPIYVRGAEPGDVLKVRINKIVPRIYGVNFNLPGLGGEFPKEFPQGSLRWCYLNWDTKTTEFLPGIVIPLRPFPGTIGVARAAPGRYKTTEPGPFGGNMDLREITAGTTLYLPVFVKGALLWSGDSHAGQGNGEVNTTAIETAFKELNLTIDVLKAGALDWPRIETPNYWVTVGYDRDLNKALDVLEDETTKFLMAQRRIPAAAAAKTMLALWDCPVAEVVDIVKGTYCRIPKNPGASRPKPLPAHDTAEDYVTVGRSADLNEAMDKASLAMIDSLAEKRKLSRLDAYGLASVAMDCRIAPPIAAERTVHCLVPKSLWDRGRL
jgi:acetamidase/formamidase